MRYKIKEINLSKLTKYLKDKENEQLQRCEYRDVSFGKKGE